MPASNPAIQHIFPIVIADVEGESWVFRGEGAVMDQILHDEGCPLIMVFNVEMDVLGVDEEAVLRPVDR